MPARKRTATASNSGATSPASPHTDDPAYKTKREKNNLAVQRTREKTKKTAVERKLKIETLKEENVKLKAKIDSEKKNIELLKDLIGHGKEPEEKERIINEILNSSDDINDDENGPEND